MGWEKFDAARAANDKPRSADLLAESIKSSLGDTGRDAKGTERSVTRGGSVVSRPVESRSVVSRPAKADFKRAAPVKGKKDRADSARTTIRMAAYNRGKKGEDVTPPRTRSADKLAEQVKTPTDRSAERAQRLAGEGRFAYPKARNEANAASQVVDIKGLGAEGHRNAAQMHRAAAKLAPDEASRADHLDRADAHEAMAAGGRRPAAAEPIRGVQRGRETEYTEASERASLLSGSAKTGEEHRAAAAAHREAAGLSFGSRLGTHERSVDTHTRQAGLEEKHEARLAAVEARKGQPKPKPTTYTAEHNGKTYTRTSPRPYTHAAVYRDSDGKEYVGSFHESASGAAKGSDGRRPIRVVQVGTAASKSSSAERLVSQRDERAEAEKAKQASKSAASSGRIARPVQRTPGGSTERRSTAETAAARLDEDRSARVQSRYERADERARQASDEARDAAGHAEAYRQHMHAANLAPSEQLRQEHLTRAVAHDRVNVYERSAWARADSLHSAQARTGQEVTSTRPPTSAERKSEADRVRAEYLASKSSDREDRYQSARKEAFESGRRAETEMTPEAFRSASAAHTGAGNLATDDQRQRYHDNMAKNYRNEAKSLEASGPTDMRSADAASSRAQASTQRSADRLAARIGNGRSTEQEIEQIQRDHPNVSLSVHRASTGYVVVSQIVVPKDERGTGTGGAIMKRLTAAADRNGDTMALTPSKDFGASSVTRLTAFYKGHGFVPNSGKNKDFATRETMIREPRKR